MSGHRFQQSLLALAAGVAFLLTACGGDSANSGAATPKPASPLPSSTPLRLGTAPPATPASAPEAAVDGCKLFTKADAAEALAIQELGPGVPNNYVEPGGGRVLQCTYISSQGANASVLIRRSTPAEAAAAFDILKQTAKDPVDVPGLGYPAFYRADLAQLFVVAKDNTLIISAGPAGARPPAPTPQLLALATKIISRL